MEALSWSVGFDAEASIASGVEATPAASISRIPCATFSLTDGVGRCAALSVRDTTTSRTDAFGDFAMPAAAPMSAQKL